MDDINAMSNTTEAKKTRRSSRGRQQIEIKKLEDESKRQVTFSKRRKGLFKKAKELSTLSGAEVGILALSKSGRVYTTDNVDAVLERYLPEDSSSDHSNNDSLQKQKEAEEDINIAGFWLDQPTENLAVEKLLEYAMALKELRENAAARLEELSIRNSTCLWPFVADQEVNKGEFVHQFMAEVNYDWCLNSSNAIPDDLGHRH